MQPPVDTFNSISEAFERIAQATPEGLVYTQAVLSDPALGAKSPRTRQAGIYRDVRRRVHQVAWYLQSVGLKPGDRVAIISNTRPEWMEADLGILCAGGVSVSVYPSLTDHEIAYILYDSGAQLIFAENKEQVEKLNRIKSRALEMPATEDRAAESVTLSFKRVITFESVQAQAEITAWAEIFKSGSTKDFASPPQKRDDLAALVYTSGTTGPPKGVMQTHGNHLANVRQVLEAELVKENHTLALFLPLAHSFAKLMGYLGFLSPAVVRFPAVTDRTSSKMDPASVTRDLRDHSSAVVPIVPRMLEKMRDGIHSRSLGHGAEASALRLALWAANQMQIKREGKGRARPGALLAYKLTAPIRRKLKHALFGDEFQYGVSGGAKLPPDVNRFFEALDIEILEGYGLTETCVATNVNPPGQKKIGTVGPVLTPDIKMGLAEDGEVLFKGPNITRAYYRREKATKAAWDEVGWFHTGDLGSIDPEGYLSIVGRKKELIVTSGGKKIAPEEIENRIKSSPYISQVVMCGDGRPYCVALVSIDAPAVKAWAHRSGKTLSADLATDQTVRDLIWKEVDRVNHTLASFETIKEIALLDTEFTVENGLMTPTFKVKRKEVTKRYQDLITKLFDSKKA